MTSPKVFSFHLQAAVSIWCCCLEMINSFRQKLGRKLKDATSSFSSLCVGRGFQKWAFKLWRHRAEEPRNNMKISPCHDAKNIITQSIEKYSLSEIFLFSCLSVCLTGHLSKGEESGNYPCDLHGAHKWMPLPISCSVKNYKRKQARRGYICQGEVHSFVSTL